MANEEEFDWYKDIILYDDQLRQLLLSSNLLDGVPSVQKWYDEKHQPKSLFYYVIKAWHDVRESLPKHLVCLLTGSAIEGASLARLHSPKLSPTEHQDTDVERPNERVEIEMDMMFVVGKLDREKGFESIKDHPGFMKINFEEASDSFVCLIPSLVEEQIYHEDSSGTKYLSSEIYKRRFQEWQPQVSKVENMLLMSDKHQQMSYYQSLEGPSASLGYSCKRASAKALDEYKLFLDTSKTDLLLSIEAYIKDLDELKIKETRSEETIKQYQDIWEEILDKQEPALVISKYTEQGCTFAEAAVAVALKRIRKPADVNAINDIPKEVLSVIEEFISVANTITDRAVYIIKLERTLRMAWEPRKLQEESNDPRFLFGDIFISSLFSTCVEQYRQALGKDISEANAAIDGFLAYRSVLTLSDYFARLCETKIGDLVQSSLQSIETLQANVEHCFQVDELDWNVDMDCVPCIVCPFWPKLAFEWSTRSRKWPETETVEKIITAGCHVVPKPATDSDDSVIEWRWSFSSAEMVIANARTKEMRRAYFIFKCLFYKHFKHLEENVTLPSYAAKTIMMWITEEFPSSWWEEMEVRDILKILLERLKSSLRQRYLKHYFIPDINIFANIPDSIFERAYEHVLLILEKLHDSLPVYEDRMSTMCSLLSEQMGIIVGLLNLEPVSSQNVLLQTNVNRLKILASQIQELKKLFMISSQITGVYEYINNARQLNMNSKAIVVMENAMEARRASGNNYETAEALVGLNKLKENELKEQREKLLKHYEYYELEILIKEFFPRIDQDEIDFNSFTAKIEKEFNPHSCTRCDDCQTLVECFKAKYRCTGCTNNGPNCSFDLCVECHSKGTYKLHSDHSLAPTTQCYPSCRTVSHDLVASPGPAINFSELRLITLLELIVNRFQALAKKVGIMTKTGSNELSLTPNITQNITQFGPEESARVTSVVTQTNRDGDERFLNNKIDKLLAATLQFLSNVTDSS